jgi:hypothetical protein
MTLRFPSCGLYLLLIVAPALPAQEPSSLLRADRSAAELSSDSGFAYAARSAFDRSAVLLWPAAPVLSGTAELERFLLLHPTESLRLSWQPLGLRLSRDSSLGTTWGVAVGSSRVDPQPPRLGRYIAVWRRDPDRWSIVALVFMGIETPGRTSGWTGLPLARPPLRPRGAASPFVSVDLAFAKLAGDSGAAVAFRSYAADDAVSFGGGSVLVQGPLAISQGVSGPERWRWHPVAAGAAGDGGLGWTVGEAIIVARDGTPNYSKYLTVWTRESEGPVRFLLDGGNARPPNP